jgi:hypothetical protein
MLTADVVDGADETAELVDVVPGTLEEGVATDAVAAEGDAMGIDAAVAPMDDEAGFTVGAGQREGHKRPKRGDYHRQPQQRSTSS